MLLLLLHHVLMLLLLQSLLSMLMLSNVLLRLRLLLRLKRLWSTLEGLRCLILQHAVAAVDRRGRHGGSRTGTRLGGPRLYVPWLARLHSLMLLRHSGNHSGRSLRSRAINRIWRAHVLLMRRRHNARVLLRGDAR